MMALTGHVTTAGAALLVWYTHAVEYSDDDTDGAREALTDADAAAPPRDALTDGDAATPPRDALTDDDAGREALTDGDAARDAVTLKPRVDDGDGDSDRETMVHCTYSRKLVEPPQPQPVQLGASCVPATMEQEFCPRHDALTTAPLPAAPKHVPCANGPDGHAPVGLP